MINDKADEVIKEFFQSILSRYQFGLETSIIGSAFVLHFTLRSFIVLQMS